jgi:type IV secretion system protein VirB9
MKPPLWLIVFLAAGAAAPLSALEAPRPSPYDSRVKAVWFNGDNVVQVDTVPGVATHIVLEEGETIVAHAFGDSEAYEFEATKHHLFIKPKAEGADTNLVVVTDKRSYKFRLTFKGETREGATYELLFRYRDAKAKAENEAAAKAAVAEGFREVVAANLDYTMSGDLELAPVNAWDDGRRTYFKFAAGVDLPAVYAVDANGDESVVQSAVAGRANDVTVVPKVSAKWMLRLGERALAVFNEAYDANGAAGLTNLTGTASPFVKRAVKGRESD